METVGNILLVASVSGIIFTFWVLYCNRITYRDRVAIIEASHRQSDWRELSTDSDQVTYNQHLWALVFLHNPWKLYTQRVQQLMSH